MSLLRLLLVGVGLVLIYRALRRALRDALCKDSRTVRGTPKKPPLDLDESQIQDAEFRDIDP